MNESGSIGVAGSCEQHYAARAVARCHDCGLVWCAECLVPPLSKRQPLRCVGCALVAAGVRTKGRRRGITDFNRSQKKTIGL